jgi:hypothetical protein
MRDGFAWATGGQLTGEVAGEVTGEVQRLLTMTIPGKPTSSKQKYRLTLKGRGLVAKLAKERGGGGK